MMTLYRTNKTGGSKNIMKVSFELTRQDYIEYNVFHQQNSKTCRKSMQMIRFSKPIIFLDIGISNIKAIVASLLVVGNGPYNHFSSNDYKISKAIQ